MSVQRSCITICVAYTTPINKRYDEFNGILDAIRYDTIRNDTPKSHHNLQFSNGISSKKIERIEKKLLFHGSTKKYIYIKITAKQTKDQQPTRKERMRKKYQEEEEAFHFLCESTYICGCIRILSLVMYSYTLYLRIDLTE